jgi:DNA-binding response OmpR family regulator
MQQVGYEVRTAKNGDEALLAVGEKQPDLILLDIMMPKLDGFEVCQTIRSNPEWKDIRIVILTAKGREVDQEKGLALGADDYITKPFGTKQLVKKVKTVLGEDSLQV